MTSTQPIVGPPIPPVGRVNYGLTHACECHKMLLTAETAAKEKYCFSCESGFTEISVEEMAALLREREKKGPIGRSLAC